MGNYTVNMPKQAGWLVYINGLEIPVLSMAANFGVWQMPTLTLDLVPHPILTRIGAEDRMQVAVFFLDHHWDIKNPTFRLLGEYEVVGWAYRNAPRGRTITLSCVSQMQIFEQLKFFYISSLNDATRGMGPSAKTKDDTITATKVLYPYALFRDGLTSPIKLGIKDKDGKESTAIDSSAYIKRPIDFVTNVFRALLALPSPDKTDQHQVAADSKYVPQSSISVPGKNFFARWLKMTKFHRRWAAFPLLEDNGAEGCFPLIKATQDTHTLPALQQQIGDSVGDSGTAWQLLQQVLSYMYMEICVIPAPASALTAKSTGNISPPWGNMETLKDSAIASIPTFFVKPRCTFALPPACNVVFPSMVQQYTVQENYIRQPTRVYLCESFISSVIAPDANNPEMANFVQGLMVTGYPLDVRARMRSLLNRSPDTSNKNFLLSGEEFFKGPNSRQLSAPPWMYMLQQTMNAEATPKSQEDGEKESAVAAKAAAEVTVELKGELTSGLGALFDLYAKSEYFRSRFAERNGGVSLLWNPYIVPGFPVVVFDQAGGGFDTMGYANTVSHNMSATGAMSTTVSLSSVRSMPEFVGLTSDDHKTLGLDIAPAEVIPEIQQAFQRTTLAHTLYRRLFYQDAPMKKSAVFDWKVMLDLVDSRYGNKLDPDKDAYRIDESVQLTPKPNYQGLFEGYDAAMQYASRPACSLKDYIQIWHTRSLDKLVADGTVRGEYTSFYSPTHNEDLERGAVFWGRIYKLKQGPGQPPPVTVSNMGPGPEYASAGSAGWDTIDTSQMAQTRANWDKKLEEYRKIVRSEDGRISPQV